MHHRELKRTTNTGRLAVESLTNSEMLVRGLGREALAVGHLLNPHYRNLLFFPHENARELNAELVAESDLPIQLIVPDGNWRQASKVAIRHPELAALPRVMIKTINKSSQHLRRETMAEGMSTLEAIACAIRVTEGEAAYSELHGFYQAKLEATLRGRGQL